MMLSYFEVAKLWYISLYTTFKTFASFNKNFNYMLYSYSYSYYL